MRSEESLCCLTRGEGAEGKGEQERNMVGGCYVVLSEMLTGSAARLPFHLVFHLGGNLRGILSLSMRNTEQLMVCVCVLTVIQPLGYFCPKQRLVGDLCNSLPV